MKSKVSSHSDVLVCLHDEEERAQVWPHRLCAAAGENYYCSLCSNTVIYCYC